MRLLKKYSFEDWGTVALFFCAFAGFALSQQICVFLYIPSRPVSVGFRLLMLCFCAFFIFRQIARPRSIYIGTLLWVFIAWACVYISRLVVYSQENVFTLHGQYTYLQMLLGMCLLPSLALMYVWDERRLRIGLYTIAVGAAIGGWGYCYLYSDAIFGGGGFGRVRGGEFIGDHVALNALQLGYAGSALLILVLGILFSELRGYRKWLLIFSMSAPGLFLVGFSASRGPVIALLGCFILYVSANFRKQHLGRLMVTGIAFSVLLTLGVIYAVATESVLFERWTNTYYALFEGEASNDISRLVLYELAWEGFIDAPLFGNFIELRSLAMYPHNFFMEALHSTGIVGFTFFLILIIGVSVIAFRLMYNFPRYSWVSLLYFHYLFFGQLSGALYSSSFFWCSLGLVFGTWQSARYNLIASGREVHSRHT
jgi:O-antigen ligase